jgi:predicted nicotinamide N-methyase
MPPVLVRYQTIEFDQIDIHIRTLKDTQQYADPLGEAEALGISSAQWPLFGVVWESSQVLAHEMENFAIKGKRILEVGCGIGLSSLLLNSRHADITATDYHPEAGGFLTENVRLNKGHEIPFVRSSWADEDNGLGKFDLVIGSDVLYERQHVKQLSEFIHRHTKPECEVLLVDPGRGHHAPFSKKMITLGYTHSQRKPENSDYLPKSFGGQILRYLRH